MTVTQAAFVGAIERAAAKAILPNARADAAAAMDEARKCAIRDASKRGVELYISDARVKVKDGSEKWPTTLARLLCEAPEKARLNNAALMQAVSEILALGSSLNGNRMSKALSVAARAAAQMVLAQFGFDGSGVERGTDIKRVVKDNVLLACGDEKLTTTTFHATGIVLDGKPHKYRRRDVTPTGLPWHDFTVRVAGADVPLVAVLKLRQINLGAFQALDEAALLAAPADELLGRNQLNREPVQHRTLARMTAALRDAHNKNSTLHYAGMEAAQLVRLWWSELSPLQRATSGVWEMARYLKSIASDPAAAARARRRLDAWVDGYPAKPSAHSDPTEA